MYIKCSLVSQKTSLPQGLFSRPNHTIKLRIILLFIVTYLTIITKPNIKNVIDIPSLNLAKLKHLSRHEKSVQLITERDIP